jgi:hypothetical protein
MKKTLLSFLACAAIVSTNAQNLFHEGFSNVGALSTNGWDIINLSSPAVGPGWHGDGGVTDTDAFGNEGEYITTGWDATDNQATGTLSTWLISPVLNVSDGDKIKFYTLSYNSAAYADRMYVRLSTAGEDAVLPNATADLGGFTTELLAINPDLDNESFPSVAGSGDTWTYYEITISGVGTNVASRVAFHYSVPDGGGMGTNSSTVGVDEFYHTGPEAVTVSELGEEHSSISFFPNPAKDQIQITTNDNAGNIQIIDNSGRVVYSRNVNSFSTVVELTDFASGIYVVKFTDSKANQSVSKFLKN